MAEGTSGRYDLNMTMLAVLLGIFLIASMAAFRNGQRGAVVGA